MSTLNPQEKLTFSSLKHLLAEYENGIPYKILKLEFDISDDELNATLLNLKNQGVILIADERIKIVEEVIEDGSEEATPNIEGLKDNEEINLSRKESVEWNLIQKLADESGKISRHVLEGNLLYDDSQLSTLGVYNLITSLENKKLIKKIQLTDGEYYSILY